MSKEEIFKKTLLDKGGYDPNEFIADYTKTYSLILEAMDEYAKQQAVAFRDWSKTSMASVFGGNTTEQLYNIFVERIKQQQP